MGLLQDLSNIGRNIRQAAGALFQGRAAPADVSIAPGRRRGARDDDDEIETPWSVDGEHRQLWVQPFTGWTPAALLEAKARADQGDMELVSDLWESQLADDRVSAAEEQRVLGLEGLPLEFHGGTRRAARWMEADWELMTTPQTRMDARRWSDGVGICPLYARSFVMSDGRKVPQLEVWHPRWLRYRNHEREWYIQTQTKLVKLSDEPGRWFLYSRSDIHGRPWVNGFWYSTATWWLAKSFGITDMAIFGQSHATPKWFLGVKSEAGANPVIKPQDKRDALTFLRKIATQASMYVPWPFDIKQEETTTYAWQVYKEQILLANRALASRILGQHLTTDEAGGAGAAMDGTLRQDLLEADRDVESAFFRDGPCRLWAVLNLPPSADAPYPVRNAEPPEDAVKAADTQGIVAKALVDLSSAAAANPQVAEALGQLDLGAYVRQYFPARDASAAPSKNSETDDSVDIPATRPPALPSGKPILLAEGETTQADRRQHARAGLKHADRLVDASLATSPADEMVKQVLTIVRGATGYADARAKLAEAMPTLSVQQLQGVLTGSILLAQAAGRQTAGEEAGLNEP